MRILIAGGSGLLGRPLSFALAALGHEVVGLSRQSQPNTDPPDAHSPVLSWQPGGSFQIWTDACGPIDAVINLAGASIGDGRWTTARKATLVSSRIEATRCLARFIAQAEPRPSVFISASAIGYYGDRGNDLITEDIRSGSDFLASLCRDWEAEALLAQAPNTRVVLLRTGIVLDPAGGALQKMLPPFRLFAGGPFGSGRQFMSWIHRDDWVSMVIWLLTADNVTGAVNATSPNPVTNADFAAALGRALHRPSWLPAPALALKLALGEMAGPLLLASQRVIPDRASRAGFAFTYPQLDRALANLVTS
jgi:uncharacterized protein (TIGR01777 family)